MIVIFSKYLDGEIKEIIGVAYNRVIAEKRVEELNNSIAKGENYFYTYEKFDLIR